MLSSDEESEAEILPDVLPDDDSEGVPAGEPKYVYLKLHALDLPDEDITRFFPPAFEFIDGALALRQVCARSRN
jgi:hypothetical protein